MNQHTVLSFFNTLIVCLLPNIGAHRYWALVEYCGSVDNILVSDPHTLPILNLHAKQLLQQYQLSPRSSELLHRANHLIDIVESARAQVVSVDCSDYPVLLRNVHIPPPLLYIRGNPHVLQLPQLAIVGSRNATHQGLLTTRLFAEHLASSGFTITSGLALGIDSAAHQAVVDINNNDAFIGKTVGRTIGVMATGIDSVYPKQNHTIADAIIDTGGALVTEFAPGTMPKPGHFPRRNRVISGLSLGVLVVEAAIKSGSLITAKYALEQGREVYAIPGSIHSPQSKGCHRLIKQGACLVESSYDIVENLSGMIAHCAQTTAINNYAAVELKDPRPSPSQPEQLLLDHMGFSAVTIDQLFQSTQLSNGDLSHHLLSLEINGWVKRSAWGYERV
ncbi:MAG: DNA processing protein [Candidatus Endobugula sp.]|jgi:DNA processing protein